MTTKDGRRPRPARRDHGRGELARIWILGVLVAGAGFWIASRFIKPAPPSRLVLATGSEGGAYDAFGRRLADALAREGVELSLRRTAGSTENVRLLREGAVDVAFVQGGTAGPVAAAPAGEGPELEGLASLYYEPLWVFLRAGLAPRFLDGLAGRRLGVGPEGSGTRAVALELLAAHGLADGKDGTRFDARPSSEAADALLAGELDAVFVVGGLGAGAVAKLAAREGRELRLFSVDRALAHERTFRYLSAVTPGEGALDLAADVPDRDVTLLAPTACLVATSELHPALVPLLLGAARDLFGGGDLFSEPGSFPSPRHLEVPLAKPADHWFREGPSFLYRVLPFRIAAVVDRMWILALPLLTLLFPLFKLAPPLYRWRIRSRIYRWYKVLQEVDDRSDDGDTEAIPGLVARLDEVEREIRDLRVPAGYGEELYNLRFHLERVRDRVRAQAGAAGEVRA